MVTPNTDWDICLKKNATDKGYGICFSVKTGPQDPKNPTMVWATYTYRWHTASGFNARINGTAAGFSTLVLSLGPYQIGTPLVIEGRTVNPDGSIKLEPATDRYIGWAQKR